MSTDQLAEITARRAGIAQPPWQASSTTDDQYLVTSPMLSAELYAHDGNHTVDFQASERTASFIAHAPADIDYLTAELTELRGHLAGIEWAAADAAGAPAQAICPACRVLKPGPHDPACWLGQVLLAEAKETVKRLAAEADRIYKPGGEPEVERLRSLLARAGIDPDQ